jgi:hypothetical protein
MKTIQFTDKKSIEVKFSFKVMQKLYLVSGITEFQELAKWANSPNNWGKLVQAVSVKDIKESEAVAMIDECNSVKPIVDIINEMAEHITGFYTIESKGENIPNG